MAGCDLSGWLGRAYYQQVGETLWQRAGLRLTNVDVVQFYENFTGPAMMALCELGFCKPDEVEAFVAGGALEGPDAKLLWRSCTEDPCPESVTSCRVRVWW